MEPKPANEAQLIVCRGGKIQQLNLPSQTVVKEVTFSSEEETIEPTLIRSPDSKLFLVNSSGFYKRGFALFRWLPSTDS